MSSPLTRFANPANDQELIRSLVARIEALEQGQSSRVGSLVLNDVNGDLTLSKPGVPSQILSGITQVEQITSAATGTTVDQDALFETLLEALEGGDVSGALATLVTLLQQGISWPALLQELTGAGGGLDPTAALAQLTTFFAGFSKWTELFNSLTDGTVTDPATALAGLVSFFQNFANLQQIAQSIFGVDIGTDPIAGLANLSQIGTNLRAFLANPLLNVDPATFQPIQQAQLWLQNVGTPAGALTSITQIPAHLYAELNQGRYVTDSMFSAPVNNQQPDPDMVNGLAIAGGGVWTYDGTKTASTGVTGAGSYRVSGSGIVREGIFVPISAKAGQITDLGIHVFWAGVTASAGQNVKLRALAYDANDEPITDSAATVCSLPNIGAASTGYSGTDPVSGDTIADRGDGWIPLVGVYQAPPNTNHIRLCVDIDSTVASGPFNFSKVLQSPRNGFIDANALTNVENFAGLWPGLSVGGFAGIQNIIDTFQHYTDGLGSAFTQGGGLSNVDLPTLFGLATTQTNNAITAAFQAALHQVVLSNRTNKSVGSGANPTSQSSLEVGHYSSGGTITTTSVAAGQAIGMIYTVPEFATYGFVNLLMQMPAGTNHVLVNIFLINTTTNAKTALFNSSDIAATIGTASLATPNRVLLPSMPMSQASDRLLIEIANNSASNALTIATKNNVVANDPNEVVSNIGWTRAISAGGASPVSLTSGQGAYGPVNAFAQIGLQNVPANYQPPQSTPYLSHGSFTWHPPAWQAVGDIVDLVGCGAAGGGGGSFNFLGGGGGLAGTWQGAKLIVGTDIKLGSTVAVVVGQGGVGGDATLGGATDGTATTFTYQDPGGGFHTLTCAAGAHGARGGGGLNGLSPGNFTQDMIPYFGGAQVGSQDPGNAPGGGGGGGVSYTSGSPGGDGSGWVRAAQP